MASELRVDRIIPVNGVPTGGGGGIIQVKSTNFNTELAYGTADGTGQSLTSGFSVIPSESYVNITSIGTNSKFLVIFSGNISASNDTVYGDGISGFGIVVDPAGGTSWSRIGSGGNTTYPNNVKFFFSRLDAGATGNDSYHKMPLSGNFLYSSSVASGTTMRFAIEYFHYDNSNHNTLYVNRSSNSYTTASPPNSSIAFAGSNATSITVMEISG